MAIAYPSDKEAKALILEMGRRAYEKGFVASNDGNLTCKVSADTLWTTPTGVSKGYMTEEMLIKTNLKGEILEGTHKPSSELKMHLRVYQENPEAGAVVHTHPLTATAFAIAGIPLEDAILPEGVVQLGVVPCAKFAMPGSQAVPDSIAPYCKDYNAVLLGNHGAVTWGKDLQQAFMRMESLEYYAQIILLNRFVMKKAQVITESELDELIQIRTSLGIMTGGRPKPWGIS